MSYVDPTSQKRCPQCGTLCNVMVGQCHTCGHVFRTQFVNPNQTTMIPPQQFHQLPYQGNQQFIPKGFIQVPPGSHPVALAIILSALCLTGAGQLVNRQYMKAVVIFVSSIILGMFITALTLGIGIFVVPVIFWPICLVDTIIIANKLNRGELVHEWRFF